MAFGDPGLDPLIAVDTLRGGIKHKLGCAGSEHILGNNTVKGVKRLSINGKLNIGFQ